MIALILFHCDTNCFKLHSFIDKTLQMCHKYPCHLHGERNSMRNSERLKTTQQSCTIVGTEASHLGRKGIGRLRTFKFNLIDFLRAYLSCVDSYWDACTTQHALQLHHLQSPVLIYNRPCYNAELYLSHQAASLEVYVYPYFQIQLTFTYFDLEHAAPFCAVHHVMVGFEVCFYTSSIYVKFSKGGFTLICPPLTASSKHIFFITNKINAVSVLSITLHTL